MSENLTGPRVSERKGDEAKSFYTSLYMQIYTHTTHHTTHHTTQSIITEKKKRKKNDIFYVHSCVCQCDPHTLTHTIHTES